MLISRFKHYDGPTIISVSAYIYIFVLHDCFRHESSRTFKRAGKQLQEFKED